VTEDQGHHPDKAHAPRSTHPVGARSDDSLAVVLEGYLADLEAGKAPEREALFAAHPAIAEQLRECLQAIEFVHGARQRLEGLPGPSTQLDDFRIVREIGAGGMGVVYEAEQVSLGRQVALKVLRFGPTGDPEATNRFRREAEIIARLHHTNIVPVYAIGQDKGVHYFAMQFIDGQSLAEYASDNQHALALDEVARIGHDAAEALAHAHERSVIHRDIKPSNLLIDRGQRIWLTDFGLARHDADLTLSLSGALLGTPRYMSPEQAQAEGHIDHRADIYGLGATLYELASGEPVFDAKTPHEILQRILADEPVPLRRLNAEIPQDFETVVMKCLSKDPGDRYQTAQELASDLSAFRQGQSISARRPSVTQRITRIVRRHKRSLAVAGASAMLALLAGALTLSGIEEAQDARRGSLSLRTADDGARIEIAPARGGQAVATMRAPLEQPLELDAGAYRLRGSMGELPSETFLVDVLPGDEQEFVLDLRRRLLWRPFEQLNGHEDDLQVALMQLPSRADLLVLNQRRTLRRIDGATRKAIWELPSVRSADEVTEAMAKAGHDRESLVSLAGYRLPEVVADCNGDAVPDLLVHRLRNRIMLVSGHDGRVLWSRAFEGSSNVREVTSPVLVNSDATPDLLVAQKGDGIGFALEAVCGATGASLWRRSIPSRHAANVAPLVMRVASAAVVVVGAPDRVYALKVADGADAGEPIEFESAEVRSVQFVAESGGGAGSLLVLTAAEPRRKGLVGSKLHAYELENHQHRWSRDLAAEWTEADEDAAPIDWPLVVDLDGDGASEVVVPNRTASANEAGYSIELLDSMTGESRWSRFWFDDVGRAQVLQSLGGKVVKELASGLDGRVDGLGALVSLAFGGGKKPAQIDRMTSGPDVNGDGCRDLFCANFQGRSLYVTALSGADGETLWWWRQNGMDRGRLAPLSFWEAGEDGLPTLLVNYDNEDNQGQITSWGGVKQLPTRSRSVLLSSSRGEIRDVIHGTPRLEVADLNGDGIKDLLSTRHSDNPVRSRFAVTTSIDAIAGRPPARFRRLGKLKVAGDLNGDGVEDLVGKGIAVSGRDGALLWRNKDAKGVCMAPLPLGDLNGDGVVDLISGQLEVKAFSGADGGALWVTKTDAMVPSEDRDLPGQGVHRGSADPPTTMVDLDGNARPELLHFFTRQFAVEAGFSNMRNEQRLAAIDAADGAVLWSAPIGSIDHRGTYSEPACGDLDGDGHLEIALVISDQEGIWQLRVMDGRDGSLRWTRSLSKRNYGGRDCPLYVRLVDLDGDDKAEVVTIDRVVALSKPMVKERGHSGHAMVASAAFRVQARAGSDGELLWSWSSPATAAHTVSDTDASWRVNAAVSDIAPHGRCLCIQMISYGYYASGGGPLGWRGAQETVQRVVLDRRGASRFLGKPRHTGSRVLGLSGDYAHACDVAAIDLDGDGVEEVLWADPMQVDCTNGLPDGVRWRWAPEAPAMVGTFDGPSRRGHGLRLMPVDDGHLLVVPTQRKLRTASYTRRQYSMALLDAEGNRRFDLAGREWLAAVGSRLPLSIQSENGATSCLVGVTAGIVAAASPRATPDPRYARRLPWFHRGEFSFFWSKVLDSLALLVLPLALCLWAWRWRSWAVGGVFVGYLALVGVAFGFGQLPRQSNLSGTAALSYAIDLQQSMPWLAWLSIGPIHLGVVLIGLPVLAFTGWTLVWFLRRRWLRLAALVVSTAAFSGGLVAYYLAADADRMSALEHYDWAGAWRVVLHAAYLVGVLLLAYAVASRLGRIGQRYAGRTRVAT